MKSHVFKFNFSDEASAIETKALNLKPLSPKEKKNYLHTINSGIFRQHVAMMHWREIMQTL